MLTLLALAGCAARQPEPDVPWFQEREAIVQTIPRGGYVQLNGGYVGVAPVAVKVDTGPSGRPSNWNVIEATDMATGASERKLFTPSHPFPERILFDLRPWIASPAAGS